MPPLVDTLAHAVFDSLPVLDGKESSRMSDITILRFSSDFLPLLKTHRFRFHRIVSSCTMISTWERSGKASRKIRNRFKDMTQVYGKGGTQKRTVHT